MGLPLAEAIRLGLITREKVKATAPKRRVTRRTGRGPQETLWLVINNLWPGRAIWELKGAVTDRQHEIDIAFPYERVAVEVDGVDAHSKRYGKGRSPSARSLSAVEADRIKDMLLRREGWLVLRYAPVQINEMLGEVLHEINRNLDARHGVVEPFIVEGEHDEA